MKACLIGATGLVGSQILELCLQSDLINEVRVFTRRATGVSHPRLTEHLVDFGQIDQWADKISGDILFMALGTTKAKVGSRSAQRRIDYEYQLAVARAAKAAGLSRVGLISAPGAHPKAWLAYPRMKGELERDVQALRFDKLCILRPGLLSGPRPEKRWAEQNAEKLLRLLPPGAFLDAARPVPGRWVARCCVDHVLAESLGTQIFEAAEIYRYGAKSL